MKHRYAMIWGTVAALATGWPPTSTTADIGGKESATNAPLPVLHEPQDGDRIFFVGDSITQHGTRPYGYVTLIQMAIKGMYPARNIVIKSSGIGHNKVQDVRNRLKKDVLDRKPTVVVVEIGLNDVYYSEKRPIDKEMFLFGLKDIIWQIRRAGAQPVLTTLTVIYEQSDGSNPINPHIEEYSNAIRALAREKQCPLIDLRPRFMAFLKKVNPGNLKWGVLTPEGDGAHLNYYGNQFLANLFLEAFRVPLPADWENKLAHDIKAALSAPQNGVTSP